MRSIPLVSLVLVLAASASGCGDVPDSPSDASVDAVGTITFEQLPAQVAATQCGSLFRCCDATELMNEFNGSNPPITTEPECVTAFTELFQTNFGRLGEAITAGRLDYDGASAADCLERIDTAACGAATEVAQSSCQDSVFIGKVAVGGMCKLTDECAGSDVNCNGGSPTTFGSCVALPRMGMTCSGSCAAGAYCDFAVMTCVAAKANGAACTFSEQCISDFCDSVSNLCATEPPTMRCDGV